MPDDLSSTPFRELWEANIFRLLLDEGRITTYREFCVTPREIIKAIMAHQPCERMGLTFDRGRQNDFLHVGPGQPANYSPRRWEEGPVEY